MFVTGGQIMKKRVLAFIMCITMMLNYAIPVMAVEGDNLPPAVVSDFNEDEIVGQSTLEESEPISTVTEPAPATSAPAPVTPAPENTPAPAPESTTTPAPESTTAPTPENTATPVPESTATPAPESTAVPGPEGTATPAPESTATPVPESTATPEPDSDPMQNPSPVPNDAGGSVTAAETFLEAAEKNYGEDGKIKQVGTLDASWAVPDLSEVKAGEQVILKLEWKLEAAATYIYTAKPEPLFDRYENTTITLTLPEGVEIVEGVEGSLSNVKEIRHEGTRWTLVLDNENTSVASAQGGEINVPLNMGRNGQRPIGESLDFSRDVLNAVLQTEFTIMDRGIG